MHLDLLRHIVSSIKTLIEKFLLDSTTSKPVAIVDVPYGAALVSTVAAFANNLPYYSKRKKTKEYRYKPDDNADHSYIMIEGVMSIDRGMIETMKKMGNKKIIDVSDSELRDGQMREIEGETPHLRLQSILRKSDYSDLVKSQ